MDPSQCVCDAECTGERVCSVQDLAEFTGVLSEMLIGKEKVTSLQRCFCRNKSSLEFWGFLFHLVFQDIFKSHVRSPFSFCLAWPNSL